MKVLSEHKIPVKMWLENIEDGALAQIKNLANFPFAFHHVAIMPDCHQGYGMPIGGVLAVKNVVIPNAVGVDIGCGMSVIPSNLQELPVETLKKIMGEIRQAVPVGFNHHKEAQDSSLMPQWKGSEASFVYGDRIVNIERESALHQLGTLGGGNHFIEIQKGSDGNIWVMIHSGSRNLGKKVADHYNKVATTLNEKYASSVPKEAELAFLPIDSEEGQDYLAEMQYCVDFAYQNRRLMMFRIIDIFIKHTKCNFGNLINIAHNYAQMEHHFGSDVMVHRKGATSAKLGEIGIIPGSQGTSSYIVEGLGNPESFNSCSHGAGRKMGRKQAERELNLEEEIKKLDEKGILHGIRGKHDLDEASGAYKDIDDVMNNQSDLVKILVKLSPLGVIKG